MTKAEMISALIEKGYSKKSAERALIDVFGVITETLEKGEKVSVSGFGIFEVRDRAEKTVVNPQTKKIVVVPARKVPAYKAAKALKEKIAK
ncbi:MAG: HU family DNA-binding protein [Clostridiales bacterium]|nr:HU family DNA-binding protein [Clostridiales bacterium]